MTWVRKPWGRQRIAGIDKKKTTTSSLGNFARGDPVLLVTSYTCLCIHMAFSKEKFDPELVPYFPVPLPRPYLSCIYAFFAVFMQLSPRGEK